MMELYLGALAFGGTLLVVSLLLGGKDVDKGGVDKDLDKGGLDKDVDLGVMAWLPVASLRFWIFFFAFGGATGAALSRAGELGTVPVAALAAGVGWVAGASVVMALRRLRRTSVGSELSAADLRGESAEVIVSLGRNEVGKVRVRAKGRVDDLIAETDDEQPIPAGATVMILGETAEGRVQVTRGDQGAQS